MTKREIKVDALARVEGEGALYLRIRDKEIESCELQIFEPPRFFEAFMVGRDCHEVPDITARICGICPVAYLMGASHALEMALGIDIPQPIHDVRRLLYCGEWIQSHVLHAAMLHAPDFLGLPDAIHIAKANPELVQKALRLKKLGNSLMEVVGGRAVHPVNTRVGGFYKAPSREKMRALIPELEWSIGASRELAEVFATFDFPDFEFDYNFVSLVHDEVYPIIEGDLGSSKGLRIPVTEYPQHFVEEHVERSNALHGRMKDGSTYFVGPLARFANNCDLLSDASKETARACGLGKVERNPFKSILVRMVETQYACEEALRLAKAYETLTPSFIDAAPRVGEGHGCTEAPRGICYHSYKIDKDARVVEARIVPPTSQNQPQIELDLAGVVAKNLDLSDDDLQWRCEQTIRNYDPCISCATHFLKLKVDRV